MWTYNYSDELRHWGIPGMKWGQRRYQNKDGSLTPAGLKRYRKLEAQSKEIEAKKTALVGSGKPKASSEPETSEDYAKAHTSKSVKSMSTQELNDINQRLLKEKTYYDTLAAVKKATYKPTLTQRALDVGKQALTDAVTEWGKTTIKNATKSFLDNKTAGLFDDLLGDLGGKKDKKNK